jgi:hypothetical protein
MEELVQYAEEMLEELGTYSLPGYALPALLIVGLFFLFAGARIWRGLVAALCFVAGGAAGYYLSGNFVIGVASGVAAAVVGLVVQYVVGVVLAGLAGGAAATLVAFLLNQDEAAWIFAIAGFFLGAILAVRFYRALLIFGTAAVGAACVAACGLVLLDETLRPDMTQYVQLGGIYLDFYRFSIGFFGLLAAGVVGQAVVSVKRKAPKDAR